MSHASDRRTADGEPDRVDQAPQRSETIQPTTTDTGRVRAGDLVALQQTAGNRAVTSLVTAELQRQPHPAPSRTPEQRLTDLERRQQLLEKRQRLTELDLRYRGQFGERLSSWRQAILRISGGMQAAQEGFQHAQVDQQQFDALAAQLILAVVSVGFAAGFEPLLTARLGRTGRTAEQVKDIVERVENPAIQAVGTGGNIAGALPHTDPGQPPAGPQGDATAEDAPQNFSGSPMAFLTANLETLEHHNQGIEQAFTTRATRISSMSDDDLQQLDVGAQEQTYQTLLTRLRESARGVESLKAAGEIATVLERHIWARWLQQHSRMPKADPMEGSTRQAQVLPEDLPTAENVSVDGFGSYIEDRLNLLGISSRANVHLTGHWYSRNTPSDWERKLVQWAYGYGETIVAS